MGTEFEENAIPLVVSLFVRKKINKYFSWNSEEHRVTHINKIKEKLPWFPKNSHPSKAVAKMIFSLVVVNLDTGEEASALKFLLSQANRWLWECFDPTEIVKCR